MLSSPVSDGARDELGTRRIPAATTQCSHMGVGAVLVRTFRLALGRSLLFCNLPVALSRADLTPRLGETTTNGPETEAHSDARRSIAQQNGTG